MKTIFRKAQPTEANVIWSILQDAIQRRSEDGSNQWQDGYPNLNIIKKDIKQGIGYVLVDQTNIIGYIVIDINNEPEYDNIVGSWKTQGDYVVYHRVAVNEMNLGQGYAEQLLKYVEQFAQERNIISVRADTNFDNGPMLHLFKKLEYLYCGKVYFRGSERLAYEKILKL